MENISTFDDDQLRIFKIHYELKRVIKLETLNGGIFGKIKTKTKTETKSCSKFQILRVLKSKQSLKWCLANSFLKSFSAKKVFLTKINCLIK